MNSNAVTDSNYHMEYVLREPPVPGRPAKLITYHPTWYQIINRLHADPHLHTTQDRFIDPTPLARGQHSVDIRRSYAGLAGDHLGMEHAWQGHNLPCENGIVHSPRLSCVVFVGEGEQS